jgi:hypothetical protein
LGVEFLRISILPMGMGMERRRKWMHCSTPCLSARKWMHNTHEQDIQCPSRSSRMPLLLSVVVLSRRERRRKCEKLRERVGEVWKNLGTHLGFLVVRERV